MLFSGVPWFALALAAVQEPLAVERWRCTLDLGGAELPFELELEGDAAFVRNGDERLGVSEFRRDAEQLQLSFPHFDSDLRATRTEDGSYLGTWRLARRGGRVAELPFRAAPDARWRFEPIPGLSRSAEQAVAGRWRVQFESEGSPAVGLFEARAGNQVVGTLLTRTGDHRYLAGDWHGERLRLSCFDGAHAFLYDAVLGEDGRLRGEFRSGDWWREKWTAERDPQVVLPDPFGEVQAGGGSRVDEVLGVRADGREQLLSEAVIETQGGAPRLTLVQVLGTWCPNCVDETAYLVELHDRYASRGLGLVGLCFEYGPDAERDRAQVQRFAAGRGVPYPLLLAGEADKRGAAATLALTDAVLAFPTTLFVDAQGRITDVHSGYAGPAAGEDHARLRREFEQRIETALAAAPAGDELAALGGETWFDPSAGESAHWRFAAQAEGQWLAFEVAPSADGAAAAERPHPVRSSGATVWIGERPWIFDRGAGLLHAPGDPLTRLVRSSPPAPPAFGAGEAASALQRREGLVSLALLGGEGAGAAFAAALADPDAGVRRVAAAALGRSGHREAVPELTQTLRSPDPHLRRLAARSLRQLGELPPGTAAELERLAGSDPFPSVRDAARSAP
jgi:hypothetical protein